MYSGVGSGRLGLLANFRSAPGGVEKGLFYEPQIHRFALMDLMWFVTISVIRVYDTDAVTND